MRLTVVTVDQLVNVKWAVNRKFESRITFNYLEDRGKKKPILHFTLKVEDSKGKFHRRGFPSRTKPGYNGIPKRLINLCWHGHYQFMKELFDRFPSAVLTTSKIKYNGKKSFESTYHETDTNIGSLMQPLQYSDACDCITMDGLTNL